ncbi:MAG TPA: single-stranded-DNA-specific exonuclease RecJ [Bacteroidales bacterium]|nr:MAG: single-stranded-DNA-specific exonuclease RecJ [Bacteroidetes bacterium GWF2_33_38]OFY87508.1 MAG: single-stranded-DNA-specific exonuclease RecJ [Bacteroidetes bacterium RIFOXYA2_FULL_33_7]HBF88266.1 single-stranded-DNA-specific exonuclease RecJ [Bacteroidales bacterium]
MEKQWVIKHIETTQEVENLASELNVEIPIAKLLIQRGVKTFDEAKAYFRPKISDLHDPYKMKDMGVAVNRLEKAIKNDERILIYGDYDVDGTTSVALVYSFLQDRVSEIKYYIPDRYNEGYGISYKAIDYADQHDYSLVIALDCGIKANEKIDKANELGIDFIICDHHYPGDELPKAVAVLDPKRKDCEYPFKELSGCGVGFKFLHAFCIKNRISFDELYQYIDLVTVSIASDIVPVIGENRVIAHFGLKKLNSDAMIGLKSIIHLANLGSDITISDIVFKIGPRINAAGRIDSGEKAVDLLISDKNTAADKIAKIINVFNNDRKDLDQNITAEAIEMIKQLDDIESKKSTVVYNPDWHKGVLGIVASRLIETYYRPTVVLTKSNGFVTGSARSVAGFDLYKAIESCSDLLENFGGHMYAAGLTLKEENLAKFKNRFDEFVSKNITEVQLTPQIDIDAIINLGDITPKFYRILKQFQPFGPENMSPVFVTRKVSDFGSGKLVGKESEHIKFDLVEETDPYKKFPAIGFGLAKFKKILTNRQSFDVCYSIEENEFMGKTSLQLRIRDIKV